MKTIVFINFPVTGHVNPQYQLCKEIAKRDVRVIYMTAERYKEKFQDIDNLTIVTYPPELMTYYDQLSERSELVEKIMALAYAFYALADKALDFVVRYVGDTKPDLIISDSLALWGRVAARYHNIPFALFFSSFMQDSRFSSQIRDFRVGMIKSFVFDFGYLLKAMKLKNCMEKKYGKVVDGVQDIMSPHDSFSVVHTSREFQPGGDSYPDTVHFLKPNVFSPAASTKKRDTIFITLGTISYSHTFWDVCLEATKNLNYRVVMSFGNNPKNRLDKSKLRANVTVYDNLSLDRFREELARSAIFINHGGFNGLMDGIMAEAKILLCPVDLDAKINGQVIEHNNCGKLYSGKKMDAKLLEKEIRTLLAMDCAEDLKRQKQNFHNAESCADVADALGKHFGIY